MSSAEPTNGRREGEDSHIVLGILQAIESGDKVTQRAVASELGIALGLVNAYLKRCMKKGLIKVKSAPARRYAYYLTPKGFAEKSKLTASYLAHSFSFFRTARADCNRVLDDAAARGIKRVALVGASELAEIMTLCATERPVAVVGIVDNRKIGRFAGLPVVSTCDKVDRVDGFVVTALDNPQAAYAEAISNVGEDRVFVPEMLHTGRSRAVNAVSATSAKVAS
jgi:predicted transcriptional regulator